MANETRRMSKSGAKRRAEPLRTLILGLVEQVDSSQEEVLLELTGQCDRAARSARARHNDGRADLVEAVGNAIQTYRLGVQWPQIPVDPEPEALRGPAPERRVRWPGAREDTVIER